ncbi:MAG: hypothetical protein Q7R50_03185 [Dehalococcoidales bacterium]|nr:hypothetical protein [Dehalococcoidales bacterium]
MRGNSSNRKSFLIVLFISVAVVWLSSACITTGPFVTEPKTDNSSSSTANFTTIFEVYTGNFMAMSGSPYEMLLVRGDGFVYYEAGTRNHFRQTSNFIMRQGQLPLEEVAKLQSLIEKCPQEIYSKFGSDQPAFAGPYAFVFSPTQAIWAYQQTGSQITANFDPFTQNLTGFPDISGEAKELWAELLSVVKSTVPTDVHPELWPDQYFDGRNYEVRPEAAAKL